MNRLPKNKQIQVISALVEGCSIRSIERMYDVHRDTIMRLMVRTGDHCMSLMDNLIKEAAEEADVPVELAASAVPVGALAYCHEMPDNRYPGGLKPDVIFVYDLELPAEFTPRNTDGEIEEFHLWSLDEAMATTRDSRDFKFNCALVNIDFFLRHGVLDPDGEPDYLDIAKGLLGCRQSG